MKKEISEEKLKLLMANEETTRPKLSAVTNLVKTIFKPMGRSHRNQQSIDRWSQF